ncbi:isocitrate lyase/phosphoenolpyruvate mutase family protein [Bosea sp. (in: a-proteobacteria)]|uniref:isocitrate lyase/PEP mutase family protein n=1 Tax=Bosea sp. (in: a-proteobacteria) TaxID=1871050 RepID=UPI002B469ED9|nr:isocitrate lyase/phosphoenolpyruvate mutase family protein [Bosea sp. (in: a-proteobacteria)]WRH56748.1 MAG: isocitrate lyase/phosphoenolpyruvate mutase family protein [Bosea sp. (in: a-proteobacteria)]
MPSHSDNAKLFTDLHQVGEPLILFNVWDAGSARAVASAGAKAIATGSWAVAASHGFEDGEQLPLNLALANLERIASAVELPVSFDLEGGYGADVAAVGRNVVDAINAGAVGFNLEDASSGRLRTIDDQVARLSAAREAADRTGVAAFINTRTDAFFTPGVDQSDEALFDEVVRRAAAFKKVGADGLFVPGAVSEALIGRLVKAVALPLNVMILPDSPPLENLIQLGVSRVSHGPGPYLATMRALEAQARASLGATSDLS